MIPVGQVTTLNRSILLTERRMSGTGGDDFRFGLPPQVPATYLRASAQWRGRLCGAALVRAFLNRTHQARIAHHIRGEDRGETPGAVAVVIACSRAARAALTGSLDDRRRLPSWRLRLGNDPRRSGTESS